MDIKHRPGSQHRNADARSRMPCRQFGFEPYLKSCLPNRMTLIREVATSIDIMYVLLDYIKKIPLMKWVLELQERTEEAHHFVSKHIGQEMVREKKSLLYSFKFRKRANPLNLHPSSQVLFGF